MAKPNILILIMSCNQDFFLKEEEILKETYLKNLNKYDNIDYYIYTSSSNKETYEENDKIYVNAPDDFNGTWEKTYNCFKYVIDNLKKYDYIIKTNTSTYINIDLLVNLLQYLYNIKETRIFSGDYVYHKKFGFGCSGNSTIYNYKDILKIVDNYITLNEFKKIYDYNDFIGDDMVINHILFKDIKIEEIKNNFAIFKSVYYKDDYKKNHIMYVGEEDLNKLRDSIFITFRKHNTNLKFNTSERLDEFEECKNIHKLFSEYKYSPYDVISCLRNYVENKFIFFNLETYKYNFF